MLRWTLASAAAAVVAVVGAVVAQAYPGTPVSFTVKTVFGGPETIETALPGCPGGATVATLDSTARFPVGYGAPAWFSGHKEFTCGVAGSFVVSFKAKVFFCETTDTGQWNVVSGTGIYAGLKGQGTLVGTYFPGDACSATGVLDAFTGGLKLP